ncbi:uncharacterized protein PG986_008451 [Apiospora aurea]|uniref:CorA-like transporter domain-containing protein n=1 Tax=Apiospora aurea TaxID=335848 RepID=A0ABR1QFF5_9PEZI
MFDELVDVCNRPQDWPVNLLDKRFLKSQLEQTRSLLGRLGSKLFIKDHAKAWVFIHEIFPGDEAIEQSMINDEPQLYLHYRKHLRNKAQDPRIRHVFLTADHSAAPLDCRLKMFQFLCTYHQVPPGFLELICSFGRQSVKWNNFHHMHILHQLSSNTPYSNMEMSEIGRSGKELRVGYKLFAMEQQEPELKYKWVMRQTATYHTLDLVQLKAFWITVKANELIQDRVHEVNTARFGPSNLSQPAEALSLSLATHQVMFNWCTDGWGWYINEIADEAESILTPITAALIPPETDALNPVPGLVKSLSSPPEKGGAQTENEKMLPPRHNNSAVSNLERGTAHSGKTFGRIPTGTFGQDEAQIKSTQERLEVLNKFSFSGVRQLDIFCNKLRDARTAITANLNMTGEINEIYRDLLSSDSRSPIGKDEGSVHAIRQFQDDIRSTAHNLSSDRLRIDNIMERISDGKNLRTELNKLFSMNQHDSSQRMHLSSSKMEDATNNMYDIAKRTERDTSSMHFITFLTLFFLPGTFLGSLFSTPIFADPDKGSILKWELLFLFLEICLPMMLIFIGLWVAYRAYKKRTRRDREDQGRKEDIV